MKNISKHIFVIFVLLMGEAMAATCTSTASGDWKDNVWTPSSSCNTASGPPAGSTVVIANGTTITVDSNPPAATNITINAGGVLRGNNGNTLSLTGNFTNNGTFTANGGTVAFTGTAQTIVGDVTFANLSVGASTVLTLSGNVTVTGTQTGTINLASTCPTNYTLTLANGTVMNSCAGGAGGGGGSASSSCIPTTVNGVPSPLIAGVGNLQLGSGGTVNGGSSTPIVGPSKNTSLPVTGTTSSSSAGALPALSPASFPAVGTGTLSTGGTVAAGSYGTINASGNPTVFSGGTYYIGTLNATGPIQLAAGTYYINSLNLRSNLSVTGPVQLFIGNQIDVKSNGISLNGGGNAGNLQVNLYSGAQFDAGQNNISFTGLIYSPFANSQVKFDNNATITGAVITAGQIDIGNNATVNFNATVQGQIASVACPVSGPDHIEIDHTGSALTCSAQTVTIKACANAACTALYTNGGITVTLSPGGLSFPIGTSGINNAATVQQSTAGIATLAATPSPSTTGATSCLNTVTGAASCAMTFNSSGFLVSVPDQVSCTNASATIEAVQSAPGTGRCIPAYQNLTRAVNLYTTYAAPTTGTVGATASTGAVSTAAPGTAHNLAFDATGKATISLSYPDAGQLTLTATDTAPSGAAMTGSGTFIAAPALFEFSGIPAAPLTAGQSFNATVTAKNACTTPAATPNFKNQTVAITSSNPLPSIGNATAINTALSGFSAGAASASLAWNEVGTIDLNAQLANYLGSALSISGTQGGVGRFHPAYFDTLVAPGCGSFSYAGAITPAKAGQPFVVTVKAKRFGGDTTDATNTANYAGTYAYLTTLSNAGVTTGLAANTLAPSSFANGVGSANVTYAVATPQTAPVTLTLRATDSDTPATSSSGHTEATTTVRSGRVRMQNAYGSELLPLPITLAIEYYDTTPSVGWRTGTDTCTVLPAGTFGFSSAPSCTAALTSCKSVVSVTGSGSNPPVSLSKPGVGTNFCVTLNLASPLTGNQCIATGATGTAASSAGYPWLQYPWGGSNAVNPSIQATFGIYKSPLIYRRENF